MFVCRMQIDVSTFISFKEEQFLDKTLDRAMTQRHDFLLLLLLKDLFDIACSCLPSHHQQLNRDSTGGEASMERTLFNGASFLTMYLLRMFGTPIQVATFNERYLSGIPTMLLLSM